MHLPVDDKLLKAADNLEEKIIKEEILPALSQNIEPLLNEIQRDKRPVVPGRVWQHEVDGWYVYSNISNDTKADDLNRISNFFNLGIKVEEGKPNS